MITRFITRTLLVPITVLLAVTPLLVPQSVAFAQNITDVDAVAYVERVDINETSIQQGSTITGSFVVRNGGVVPIDDVQYRVSLTGVYERGLPTEVYDTVLGDTVFDLAIGETATVPFVYTLPKRVAGTDLGIEIELFLSTGASLGWNHADLTVEGEGSFLVLKDAFVQKGTETYVLDFGPTFLASEQPELGVVLVNQNAAPVTVIPRAEFSSYQDRATTLVAETFPAFTVPADGEANTTLALPTFDRKAGVYFGTVYLEDAVGVRVGPTIDFQYIIDGDIATVHDVVFSQTELARGDSVAVTVKMTGKPFAPEVVNDTLESTLDGYTFVLTLKNEKQEVVATYSEELNGYDETVPKEVVLSVSKPVAYPIAEVVLKKGDTVVTTYTTNVPDWVLIDTDDAFGAQLLILYGMLLAALVTLALIFMIKRDTKVLVTVFGLVILVLIGLVLIFTYVPASVRAAVTLVSFTQTDTGTGRCANSRGEGKGCGRVGRVWSLIPGVTINQPTVINDDGTFLLTGNMTFDSCGNSTNSRHIWEVLPGGSLRALSNQDTSAMRKSNFDSRGHWFDGSKRFSVQLTAADACGVQTFNLRFVNCVAGECGFRNKQITLDLGPCDVCPNIEGNQREVPGGYRLDTATNQCLLTDDFQVLCSASQNPITPGSSVTFNASTFNAQGDVQFTWYTGRNGSGDVIKTERNVTRSRLDRTFAEAGMYQVSVRGQDQNGASFTRTCGVMVRDENADPNELVDTDGDGIPDTSANDLLRAAAPPPVLNLTIDRVLTNDTCNVEWSAQHVTQCFLVNGADGTTESVTSSGTKPVEPGTYWLRCLALRDGSVAETNPVTCRLNPGVREI